MTCDKCDGTGQITPVQGVRLETWTKLLQLNMHKFAEFDVVGLTRKGIELFGIHWYVQWPGGSY